MDIGCHHQISQEIKKYLINELAFLEKEGFECIEEENKVCFNKNEISVIFYMPKNENEILCIFKKNSNELNLYELVEYYKPQYDFFYVSYENREAMFDLLKQYAYFVTNFITKEKVFSANNFELISKQINKNNTLRLQEYKYKTNINKANSLFKNHQYEDAFLIYYKFANELSAVDKKRMEICEMELSKENKQ